MSGQTPDRPRNGDSIEFRISGKAKREFYKLVHGEDLTVSQDLRRYVARRLIEARREAQRGAA